MEQLRPVQMSNVSLPTFPRISHRRLHFYWFCNCRPHVCLTTALHSPTSINKRLLVASKVESLTLSNPHSKLYWLERRSACRYTHPIRSNAHWKYKLPPWTTAFIPAATATFWSGTITTLFYIYSLPHNTQLIESDAYILSRLFKPHCSYILQE